MGIRIKGYRTYTVLAAIAVLAFCQRFLSLEIPKEVWMAMFAAALGFMKAGMPKASSVLLFVLPSLLMGVGCVSDKQQARHLDSYDAYVKAKLQTYDPLCVEGTNMSVTISGVSKFKVTAPLDKLEAPPTPYDAGKDLIGLGKSVAEDTTIGYLGGKIIGKVNPVQTAPVAKAAATATTP